MTTNTDVAMPELPGLALALLFHETYERLAPQFGYETRLKTREFDPGSPNGKLMIAVCAAIQQAAGAVPEGFQIVPIEPTPEMIEAAHFTMRSEWSDPVGHFVSHYKAMLAASPSPPKQQPVHLVGGELARAVLHLNAAWNSEASEASLAGHIDLCRRLALQDQGGGEVGGVPLSEDQQVACLVKAGCIGTVRMSFESGPYDITRPSINASRLIEEIEAAHGIKEAS